MLQVLESVAAYFSLVSIFLATFYLGKFPVPYRLFDVLTLGLLIFLPLGYWLQKRDTQFAQGVRGATLIFFYLMTFIGLLIAFSPSYIPPQLMPVTLGEKIGYIFQIPSLVGRFVFPIIQYSYWLEYRQTKNALMTLILIILGMSLSLLHINPLYVGVIYAISEFVRQWTSSK